jgi:hypothetical protein
MFLQESGATGLWKNERQSTVVFWGFSENLGVELTANNLFDILTEGAGDKSIEEQEIFIARKSREKYTKKQKQEKQKRKAVRKNKQKSKKRG